MMQKIVSTAAAALLAALPTVATADTLGSWTGEAGEASRVVQVGDPSQDTWPPILSD